MNSKKFCNSNFFDICMYIASFFYMVREKGMRRYTLAARASEAPKGISKKQKIKPLWFDKHIVLSDLICVESVQAYIYALQGCTLGRLQFIDYEPISEGNLRRIIKGSEIVLGEYIKENVCSRCRSMILRGQKMNESICVKKNYKKDGRVGDIHPRGSSREMDIAEIR